MILPLCLLLALLAAPVAADEPSPKLSILESSGRFTVDVSTSPAAGAPQEKWDRWRPQFTDYDVVLRNFNGSHTAKGVVLAA